MAASKTQNVYNTFKTGSRPLSHKEHDNPKDVSKTSQLSRPALFQAQVILVLMLGVLGVAISSAAVQVLSGTIPEFELNAWRFGFQWIITIPIITYKGCKLKVPLNMLPLMGLSILLLNSINVFMFTAYIYLPLGLADGLINAIIIAGNAVLSICIKSDRKLALYVGAVICIIGLVLMMQPDFLFSGSGLPPPLVTNWTSTCKQTVVPSHKNMTIMDSSSATSDSMGYIYAVIASVSFITYYHGAGRLVQDVDVFICAFWHALLGTLISIVFMIIFEEPTFLQSGFCIALLLKHSFGSTAISVANPWSLQNISPSVCALINTLKMVIMVVFQYTILHDVKPGLQNWVEILGAITCFCGMLGGPLTEIIRASH